jgi:hypothetical protein
MKTHRPWQPHMGNSPLFNPYTPAGQSTTLDHFDLVEEEQVDETEAASGEEPRDQAVDPPPVTKRD